MERKTLRSIPQARLSDTRKKPWRDGNHTRVAELEPPKGGQWVAGKFLVPRKYAAAPAHTNEHLEAQRYIAEALQRWRVWKARTGWYPTTTPEYLGFKDLPSPDPLTPVDDELVEVHVRCKFTRWEPLYMSMDSMEANLATAARDGIEITDESNPVESTHPTPVDHVDPTEPAHNPAKVAYERQAEGGLTQKDLLIGDDPRTPLGEEHVP